MALGREGCGCDRERVHEGADDGRCWLYNTINGANDDAASVAVRDLGNTLGLEFK